MRLLSIFLFLIFQMSCSSNYLVQYSVISEGEYKILYYENIEVESSGYWVNDVFSDDVNIYVVGEQELDVRVMYIGKRGFTLYNRTVGEGPILIQGKIYDL